MVLTNQGGVKMREMRIKRWFIEKEAVKFTDKDNAEIEKETEKAVLIQGNWIPKSVIEFINPDLEKERGKKMLMNNKNEIKNAQKYATDKAIEDNDIILNINRNDYLVNHYAIEYFEKEV